MRGVYTATINISPISAAKTLILLQNGANTVVEILSARVTNRSNETNEQLEVELTRVATAGSPTGTSITACKSEDGDAASACTVIGDLSAEPSSYATTPIDRQGMASLSGYDYTPIPEARAAISPSDYVGLRLITTPSSSFNCTATLTWREIGG